MEKIELQKEKCMKVTFRDSPEVRKIFEGLPPIFKVEQEGSRISVYCPVGLKVSREHYNLKVREFYKAFKAVAVERGRKIWKGDSIIFEPEKDSKVAVRFASTELDLISIAAKNAKQSLSDYVRVATLGRVRMEFGL